MESDDALILRCRSDPAAMRGLIERYQARIYSFLIRLAGREASDDLFQEVWVRVFENADRYEARGKAASWFFKIANNLAMNHLSKRRKEGGIDLEEEAMNAADPEPPPEAQAQNQEAGRRLVEAIKRLPAEQRQVFLMREYGELSFKDIAQALDIPLGTALSRMNYALGKLRGALEDYHA